jgi:hypothetical protein
MKLIQLFIMILFMSEANAMNNYVDQYGRYHDKPVTAANPVPSNNGWIYTAYAKKAGLPVDDYKLRYCAELCSQGGGVFWRTPSKEFPPMSRDEILGLVSLDIIAVPKNWNFSPFPIPEFSLRELIPQLALLYQHRAERNYFWENHLDQIYRFAFSVPLADRHFILSKQGKFNIFYWAIAKVDSMIGSASGIKYLKYGNSKEAMQQEFPIDHPIRSI